MHSEIISTLYDHYKDTCSIISDAIRRRDRLMIFVIIALGFFAFQTLFPDTSNHLINDFLSFKFGLTLKLELPIIGSVIWFLILLFTIRYFQVAIFVERQYEYIHKLEDKLNKHLKDDLITREGKTYLFKYPWFSDWMWFIYTLVFPLILLLVSSVKIANEWESLEYKLSFSLFLNSLVFVLLLVSIVLYLIMLHFRKR